MLEGRSMDYEGMGIVQGMAAAVKNVRANADRNMDVANAEIDKANDEIARLRKELAATKAALAVEVAHKTGILAQGRVLREELSKVSPGHAILKRTGKIYPNGNVQVALNLVYEASFDAKAKELGIRDPKSARAVAK